jgi:hypothetical protein
VGYGDTLQTLNGVEGIGGNPRQAADVLVILLAGNPEFLGSGLEFQNIVVKELDGLRDGILAFLEAFEALVEGFLTLLERFLPFVEGFVTLRQPAESYFDSV